MRRVMFAAFVAFWSSVATIWSFATLASGSAPPVDTERSITLAELATHAITEDCWMAIDGVVYDLTAYLPAHPTPTLMMAGWCGQEASEAYGTKGYGRPHSPVADALLPRYRVGTLSLTGQ